jgi:hypothetical protein
MFAIIYLVVYSPASSSTSAHVLFLAKLTYWNLAIGFGATIAALILFTKWR